MDAPVSISARGDPATGGRNVSQGRVCCPSAPCPASPPSRSDPETHLLIAAGSAGGLKLVFKGSKLRHLLHSGAKPDASPAIKRLCDPPGQAAPSEEGQGGGPTAPRAGAAEAAVRLWVSSAAATLPHCRAQGGAAAAARDRVASRHRRRPAGSSIAIPRSVGSPPAAVHPLPAHWFKRCCFSHKGANLAVAWAPAMRASWVVQTWVLRIMLQRELHCQIRQAVPSAPARQNPRPRPRRPRRQWGLAACMRSRPASSHTPTIGRQRQKQQGRSSPRSKRE